MSFVDLSSARLSIFREDDDFWTREASQLLDDYVKIQGIDCIDHVTGESLAAFKDTFTWCGGDQNTQKGVIATFDAKKSQFIDRARVHRDWISQAYPLKQLVIRIQGTKSSDKQALIDQLETVVSRLKAGDESGLLHDDDFGFSFDYSDKSNFLSFFSGPSGSVRHENNHEKG